MTELVCFIRVPRYTQGIAGSKSNLASNRVSLLLRSLGLNWNIADLLCRQQIVFTQLNEGGVCRYQYIVFTGIY